ncbi:MAG: PEPxxWA-CTERM sorting domain-containing protein [Phenylobacterium sp.]|uniref:PEPxxWA-CTERM sorting domain-containing protein n=1 Tax=Phenylobacterium sp. TaxID=1871053 RepID=UPI001A39D696|nr:PEPxxWA-CTERM sorting domain-containing protein [Phenylobacterium sp.]MBL8771099.1 PEPxxWA-CTERM sorting domain-containing protein [Phenylobacterium sp.]
MTFTLRSAVLGILAAGAMAASAGAAEIAVVSYDMPNGSGQASGGSFNYWDLGYSGSGSTNVDGAALTGGVGDLTDGVVATDYWFNVENSAGSGPYVGWYALRTLNPLITFNLASAANITQIDIHLDNSFVGGVFAPSAIWVDGVAQAFTAPAPGSIGTVSLTGLNLTGTSHTIQFFQANQGWTFVSEVDFIGTTAVPEPGTWALLIGGFGMAGAALRRRRAAAA